MGKQDIDKVHIIRSVIERKYTQVEAARILRLSDRQVRRLCIRVRADGACGVLHGLRGQPSNHQLDPEPLGMALSAVHDPLWEGFGPTFAQQKLEDWYSIVLSDWKLRQLMLLTGIWKSRRHRAKHRAWRERRSCLGELSQLDGSPHDWFEGRGPECVLLIFIDDATSRILYGVFIEVESTLHLMRAAKAYLRQWGRPIALYVDKDSIYNINREASVEEDLRGEGPITQFTRAMSELDIEVILANSPQAKGRVERGFDTHQDRLVKELRLRGISNIADANVYLWGEYISEHNRRFAVEPASPADAHRPLLELHDLAAILSVQVDRQVSNDFVVRHRNRFFQLGPKQPVRVCRKAKICVQERLDGTIRLVAKGQRLKFHELPSRPSRRPAPRVVRTKELAAKPRRSVNSGSQAHPWRALRTPARPSQPATPGPCHAATMGD